MNEEEIRPNDIFDEYLRLCEIDSYKYFKDSKYNEINCPACENAGDFSFTKNDFTYKLCAKCSTLFVSPRPASSAFQKYYLESDSVRYWASTFYKETAKSRREKVWRPKAKSIIQIINSYELSNYSLIDIGAGYGIFCEELQQISDISVTAIEPGPDLSNICRKKGLNVINNFLENVNSEELIKGPKIFTSFELFEHLHNPKKFLLSLLDLMKSKDIFIFTTLSGNGVDIQALWENSKSIYPPHHLNFFNTFSIELLLSKLGFKILEISTPGQLDIDILMNNENLIRDRFWKTFIKHSSKSSRAQMQSLISKSGLSSHMMVCCQKI